MTAPRAAAALCRTAASAATMLAADARTPRVRSDLHQSICVSSSTRCGQPSTVLTSAADRDGQASGQQLEYDNSEAHPRRDSSSMASVTSRPDSRIEAAVSGTSAAVVRASCSSAIAVRRQACSHHAWSFRAICTMTKSSALDWQCQQGMPIGNQHLKSAEHSHPPAWWEWRRTPAPRRPPPARRRQCR